MKFKTVDELSAKINSEIKEDESFELMLMEKYPSLFNTDENGALLSPDCGISCPPGWQDLVDKLCGSIVFHVKNNHVYTEKKFFALPIRRWIWKHIGFPIRHWIDPKTNAYNGRKWMTFPESNKIDADHPYRTYIVRKIFRRIENRLVPWNKYNLGPIPEVKIGQIKEKFGTLRFYYDGGNDVIRGMVSFAETMSSNICEITGEAGSLCRKGKGMSWYRTLSERKANEIGYTKVE